MGDRTSQSGTSSYVEHSPNQNIIEEYSKGHYSIVATTSVHTCLVRLLFKILCDTIHKGDRDIILRSEQSMQYFTINLSVTMYAKT